MAQTHNADPAELAKFGELAHRWWDPQSEFRPLHEINPLRLGWIDRHAHLEGKKALDVLPLIQVKPALEYCDAIALPFGIGQSF